MSRHKKFCRFLIFFVFFPFFRSGPPLGSPVWRQIISAFRHKKEPLLSAWNSRGIVCLFYAAEGWMQVFQEEYPGRKIPLVFSGKIANKVLFCSNTDLFSRSKKRYNKKNDRCRKGPFSGQIHYPDTRIAVSSRHPGTGIIHPLFQMTVCV